jgi:hypothetical protein
MVEREKIRTYAQELAEQKIFLNLVLWYVVSKLQHKILNSGDPKASLLDGALGMSHDLIVHLKRHLADYLEEPGFWETCAEQIQSQLDDWKTSGEKPFYLGSYSHTTSVPDPSLFDEDIAKEVEIRDRFAVDAADLGVLEAKLS